MKFTILIPLEFNRGLAVKCIQAWTRNQSYPRDDYDILIAASEGHSGDELNAIRDILDPQDRIVLFPVAHDMALVASAAKQATGDIFVFTESHCIPDGDFLSLSKATLEKHAEWVGFSGMSYPITHNLLSVVESDMYHRDIINNLENHPWLKVLDQCFVITREAYWASEGLDPDFGHFAEWLLAGRIYKSGFRIGYNPEVKVGHYYIGDLKELKEFTLDFTKGEMKFASQSGTDRCGDLFTLPQEWTERTAWNNSPLHLLRVTLGLCHPRNLRKKDIPWLLSLLQQLIKSLFPLGFLIVWKQLRILLATAFLEVFLLARWEKAAAATFRYWLITVVQLGRLQFLANFRESFPLTEIKREWTPQTCGNWKSLGFHVPERFQEIDFCWTEPTGGIELQLGPGYWEIKIQVAPFAVEKIVDSLRFFIDGQIVPDSDVCRTGTAFSFSHTRKGTAPLTLSWICPGWRAPDDRRVLGIPIAGIQWKNEDDRLDSEPFHDKEIRPPVYFLHVPKCAGTSICALLENNFSAGDCLSSSVYFYFARQIPVYRDSFWKAPFVVGHFGWEMPELSNGYNGTILTLLRHPYERIISLYDYQRQQRRISPAKDFAEWLENDIRCSSLQMAHFSTGLMRIKPKGFKKIQGQLESNLEEALSNLRQCAAVGLQEEIEGSIDLFCSLTGCYPPPVAERFNVTLNRNTLEDLPPQALKLLDTCFAPEVRLYEEAKLLFQQQLSALKQTTAREHGLTEKKVFLRKILREDFFRLRSSKVKTLSTLIWTPEGPYIGSNLHKREFSKNRSMRWTGPEIESLFYVPVGSEARAGEITLKLHEATSAAQAKSVSLKINGVEIPLKMRVLNNGFELTGKFPAIPNAPEYGAYAEFTLRTEIISTRNEFRSLGIALEQIRLSF